MAARSWLDAELGRQFDNGIELEILGGMNWQGFTITRDDANNRYNFTATSAEVLGRSTFAVSGTGSFDNVARGSSVYLRITATGTAVQSLTGILAGSDRQIACMTNTGTQLIVIKNDATSTAANRFLTPDSRDFPLPPGSSVWAVYDLTSARWRVVGSNTEPAQGTLLTGAAGTPGQSIIITEGSIRYLRTNLANNFVLDINNTSARDDETITIVRSEPTPSAFTFTIRDNADATIGTLTPSIRESVTFKKATGANFANAVYTRL